MIKRLKMFLALLMAGIALNSKAFASFTPAEYAKYFEIDLNAPIPDLKALEKEQRKLFEVYNPRYVVSWDMGAKFDPMWVYAITNYGLSEKRLKNQREDALLDMIKSLPPEYYPYIGPRLHEGQGISEKILNMPGIKETKHKFPERIAPQLADIEDLEFLSPYMYLLLMPEVWPSNMKSVEMPHQKPAKLPKIEHDPQFIKNVIKNVPDQGFGGAARSDSAPTQDDLRTLKITKDSPLTSADIKAFLATIGNVKAFGTLSVLLRLQRAGILLDYWEQKNGMALPINSLKDGVNPCQRLALKVKWAGLHNEFTQVVGSEGFNIDEWAYTCDKTIKAYRVARVSGPMVTNLRQYKAGVYDKYVSPLKPLYRDVQYSSIQALLEMHKAPRNDVLLALKNEAKIKETLTPLGGMLLIEPLNN